MSELNCIALDPAKEGGIWETYPGTDIRLKIRRMGNQDYQKAFVEVARARRREIKFSGGLADPPKSLQAPLLGKHILVDWENMGERNDEGKLVDIPYSSTKATEILLKERFDELYQFVVEVANDSQGYLDQSVVEDAGNSRSSSNGKGETPD